MRTGFTQRKRRHTIRFNTLTPWGRVKHGPCDRCRVGEPPLFVPDRRESQFAKAGKGRLAERLQPTKRFGGVTLFDPREV